MKITATLPAVLLLASVTSLSVALEARAATTYENYTFTTFVGATPGWHDGNGTQAQFNSPASVSADNAGNVYVADANNHTIRKISPSGEVRSLAGLSANPGTVDGIGGWARFETPCGVAVDANGVVYVADTQNHTVRKISSDGTVTTIAGSAGTAGKANGTGSAARFYQPQDVAVDPSGNVYVADTLNSAIRKITPAGVVTTLAGLAGTSGSANGSGTTARFYRPYGIATDNAGNIYVGDTYNHTIRKISPAGKVTTLAGSAGKSGSADGTNTTARFHYPCGLSVDASGNVYVADINNHTIRKVTPSGIVTTVAGLAGNGGDADGNGSNARFNNPESVAVVSGTNLVVADVGNSAVRLITPDGKVTTLAGMRSGYGSADGTGAAARMHYPGGVAVHTNGVSYVADFSNHTIRKITPDGTVSTLAGLAGVSGSADGTGSNARFNQPVAVAVDADTNVYVAEYGNNLIRKVTAGGVVTTLAGSTTSGSADGTGSTARFNKPCGIAVGTNGMIYVSDTWNHKIRMITPGGVVTTVAGSTTYGSANGNGTSARFYIPQGVAADASGNLYVSDTANNMIRKIAPDGTVTTLAGSTNSGSADGTGTAASFYYPFGLAVDAAANVYVSDAANDLIRKITPSGTVTTLAGSVGRASGDDGTGESARFSNPEGIAVDPHGNLLVADAVNHAIRKGSPALPDSPLIDVPSTNRLGVSRTLSVTNAAASSWQWSLVRMPATSAAQLSSPAQATTTIAPDVADIFVVRLDAADNTGRSTIAGVLAMVDTAAPQLTITSPTAGRRWSNAVFTVTGTAGDNLAIAGAWCQANNGSWVTASGTSSWTAAINLTPGTNILHAYAMDTAGNLSATQNVSFYYAAFTPLQVVINGKGTLTPNYNGKSLEISKSYKMTAAASPGFAFNGWTGGVVSPAAALSFAMSSNLTLIANFKDIVKPTVAIKYPKPSQLVSNALLTASGTAGDTYRLASVWCRLNNGGWIQAGTNNWSVANLVLTPGTNVLQAYAVDADGNLSVTSKVVFTYVLSAPLTLAISGQGTLSPNYSNALLEIGRTYRITAKPAVGNVFSNWVGLFSTNAATLSFTMQSNLALQANFVPNPFPHLQGNYAGLFLPTNGVTPTNAGYFTGKIDGSGNFSGSITLGATTYPLSGPLSVGGAWSKSVPRTGKPALAVQWQADLAGGEALSGSVGDGTWLGNLVAYRAVYAATNPAPQSGRRFTFAIPGSDDASAAPAGFGYGWATVGVSGNVTVGGVLGDGTPFSRSTVLDRQGQWPFFASVNSAAGIIIGWVTFTNDVGTDLQGVLSWHRNAQAAAKLYPAGFDFPALEMLGSAYAYTNGVPLLSATNGQLILTGGNLPQPITNAYALTGSKITGPNRLSLTATNSNGLFRGTVTNALSRSPITVAGALLQKQAAGYGYFSGTNQSGSAFLESQNPIAPGN